jgi:hypothetical protein
MAVFVKCTYSTTLGQLIESFRQDSRRFECTRCLVIISILYRTHSRILFDVFTGDEHPAVVAIML